MKGAQSGWPPAGLTSPSTPILLILSSSRPLIRSSTPNLLSPCAHGLTVSKSGNFPCHYRIDNHVACGSPIYPLHTSAMAPFHHVRCQRGHSVGFTKPSLGKRHGQTHYQRLHGDVNTVKWIYFELDMYGEGLCTRSQREEGAQALAPRK